MSVAVPLVFSLREQIVDALRNDVLSGRLLEGQRLEELKLVTRFGVSRTPIREALHQLLHEGLLEARPNAGMTVATRPPDEIRELVVPIRRNVEAFAVRSIFPTLGDTDFAAMHVVLDRMRAACEARDFAAIAEHDIGFHRWLVRRAKQRDLESIWSAILARIRSHFWETQQRDYTDPLEIYTEHVCIVETFRQGNVEKAVKAIEDNIC